MALWHSVLGERYYRQQPKLCSWPGSRESACDQLAGLKVRSRDAARWRHLRQRPYWPAPVQYSQSTRYRGLSVAISTFISMIIDCESCVMRDIACRDCVVSVLIEAPSSSADKGSEIGIEESRVIDLLASRGMIPPLRYAQNEKSPSNSQRNQALSG